MNVLPQISNAQATLEVPQTIVANISELPEPVQITPKDIMADLNDIIYHSSFTVDAADPENKVLAELHTDNLFVGKNMVMPHSYILNQAIRATYNVEFILEYSKLPGCIFAFKWSLSYSHGRVKNRDNTIINRDSGIIYVDSQSTDVIKASLPWNGMSEHCLYPQYSNITFNDAKVTLKLELYERYKPTLLQPPIVDILVYVRYTDLDIVGRYMDGSNTFRPFKN